MMAYLVKSRGLDAEITRTLMRQGKLYETVQVWDKEKKSFRDIENRRYHNIVFVAYDRAGKAQNAYLRGTIFPAAKPFKQDLEGSDKSFPFSLPVHQPAKTLCVFESAIDALSHASIAKDRGDDWRNTHRISLAGVSFLSLERYLADNPHLDTIISCLDNDATGNRRSQAMEQVYTAKGYAVKREAPVLKDFNEDLLAMGPAPGKGAAEIGYGEEEEDEWER
jgi:hypothetical protein